MGKSKRTLVIGASTNPMRYSYAAMHRLTSAGHEAIPVGVKRGEVAGKTILNEPPQLDDVDTVTLYIGPKIQESYHDYLLDLKPKRVIFNPGTINPPFMKELEDAGVEVIDACTLVILATGDY